MVVVQCFVALDSIVHERIWKVRVTYVKLCCNERTKAAIRFSSLLRPVPVPLHVQWLQCHTRLWVPVEF